MTPKSLLWLPLMLVLALTPLVARAQQTFQFQNDEMALTIMSEQAWEMKYRGIPEIPRTEEDILTLARRLYPPLRPQPEVAGGLPKAPRCGTHEANLLGMALQNPAVSDQVREEVDRLMVASEPTFTKVYDDGVGHFKIYYTDSDPNPDHNVFEPEVIATHEALTQCWGRYVAYLKEPMAKTASDGRKMLTVKVYYLGDDITGYTSAFTNSIRLNSRLAVGDQCLRQTTSAHELFHRVQFAYDLIAVGSWAIEGMAVWAEKFTYQSLRTYMANMNIGLRTPDKSLAQRDYDAAHFWVFLAEKAGWTAIRDIMAGYLDSMKEAVGTVVKAKLGLSFDDFTKKWQQANYIKRLYNAGAFDYNEDDNEDINLCGKKFGPLAQVPLKGSQKLPGYNARYTLTGTVGSYGAAYYEFPLAIFKMKVTITVSGDPNGIFYYYFMGIKNNEGIKPGVLKTGPTGTFTQTLTPGEWDKILLVVGGKARGGSFTITAQSSVCDIFTPIWSSDLTSSSHLTFSFTGVGYNISSGAAFNVSYCIPPPVYEACHYSITGSFYPPNLYLTLTKFPYLDNCCPATLSFKGKVSDDCNSISGTLTGTNFSKNVVLYKVPESANLISRVQGGRRDCPTCP